MTQILFPELSDTPGAQGTVATWYADDGAQVAVGDLIAECAVDKVDTEVTAPVAGTLPHRAAEGAIVDQGSVIAVIE